MNTKLPAGGWIPGDMQYMTGPFCTSGAAALHIATRVGPSMTAGFFALT